MGFLERRMCLIYILMSAILFLLITLTRQARGVPPLEAEDLYFFMAYIPITLFGTLLVNCFSRCATTLESLSNLFVSSNNSRENGLPKNSGTHDHNSNNFSCLGNDSEVQMTNSIDYRKDSIILTYSLSISKLKQKNTGVLSNLTLLPQHGNKNGTSGHDSNTSGNVSEPQQDNTAPANSSSASCHDIANSHISTTLGTRKLKSSAPHRNVSQDEELKSYRSGNAPLVKGRSAQSSQESTYGKKPLTSEGVETAKAPEENIRGAYGRESLNKTPDLAGEGSSEQALANVNSACSPQPGTDLASDKAFYKEMYCRKLEPKFYPLSDSNVSPLKTKRNKMNTLKNQINSIKTFHISSKKKGKRLPDSEEVSPMTEYLNASVSLGTTNIPGETKSATDMLKEAKSGTASTSFDKQILGCQLISDLDEVNLSGQLDGQLQDLEQNTKSESYLAGHSTMPDCMQPDLCPRPLSPSECQAAPPNTLLMEIVQQSALKSEPPKKSIGIPVLSENEEAQRPTSLKWKSGILRRVSSDSPEAMPLDTRHTGATPKLKFNFRSSSESSTEALDENLLRECLEKTLPQYNSPEHRRGRSRQRESTGNSRWRRKRPSSPRKIYDPIGKTLEFSSEEDNAEKSSASNAEAASYEVGKNDCQSASAIAEALPQLETRRCLGAVAEESPQLETGLCLGAMAEELPQLETGRCLGAMAEELPQLETGRCLGAMAEESPQLETEWCLGAMAEESPQLETEWCLGAMAEELPQLETEWCLGAMAEELPQLETERCLGAIAEALPQLETGRSLKVFSNFMKNGLATCHLPHGKLHW